MTPGEWIKLERLYSDARSLVTISGVSDCDDKERVFIFAYDIVWLPIFVDFL
jgi:hypothetical protein